MGADIIQAQYNELTHVASRFGGHAEANQQLLAKMRQALQPLQAGGWEGRGSAAFFAEMNGEVLPVMQRLTAALEQARSVMLHAHDILKNAEEEASRPFRGSHSGAAATSSQPDNGSGVAGDNPAGLSWLGAVGGGLTGGGAALWFATVFQNKPDVVGNARLGFKPAIGRWQRNFHLDGPHGRITYPHFNAEIGPLRAFNHQRVPSWLHRLGGSSVLRGIGKATVVLGLAVDTYTIVTAAPNERGGAIGGVAGGWGGVLAGAAIGSAICPGVGTVIGGLIGGFAGGLAGEWAGHELFD